MLLASTARMPNVKPVYIISDTHLGAGNSNDFYRTFELHQFLQRAEKQASELVLLGDIFELLQSELTEIYIQHHEIIQHIFRLAEKIPVTFVLGNHDAFLAVDWKEKNTGYLLGSRIVVTPTYQNPALSMTAIHGHQYDAVNRREDMLDLAGGSTPGDRISRAVGWLEEHVHKKSDSFLEKLYLDYKLMLKKIGDDTASASTLVTPAHPLYEKLGGTYSEYEAGAADLLKGSVSLVAMGHTHQQGITPLEGGLYVNTGSWVGSNDTTHPPTFASISKNEAALYDAVSGQVLAKERRC